MKRFILLCFLFPVLAIGAPVSLDLQQVPVKDLIRLVYGSILGQSYVIDGSVQDDLKPVSLKLDQVTEQVCESVLVDLLRGQGVRVDRVKGLVHIRRLDKEAEAQEVFIYRPKYRSVQYLLGLVTAIFPQGSFVNQRSSGMGVSAITGSGYPSWQGQGASATSTGQQGQINSQNRTGTTVPGTSLMQGVNQMLDSEPDTIVFRGSEGSIEKLQKLFVGLDVSSGEVMVKAVIYEVQTKSKIGSAIDLAASILSGKFGGSLVNGAADAVSNVFFKLKAGGTDVSAIYSALSSDDRFKAVSSPRLRVRSGASAHFSVGDETPILGSVSYDSTGRPIQSVQYKSSGVIFDLKPQVRESGVDVHVSQQISSFIQTTNGVNSSPTLTKRELSTDLTISDDEIVVIGGLESDSDTKSDKGLSFLPDFFRSQSSDTGKSEILLLLNVTRI